MRRAFTSALRYARAIEAAACTVAARLAVRCLPFRVLARAFTRPIGRRRVTPEARLEAIAKVRRAIASADMRLPGVTSCLARASAAQWMLRRRGVETTVYYGATTSVDRRLRAHVWLCADDIAVVGRQEAGPYKVVMTYSCVAPIVRPARRIREA